MVKKEAHPLRRRVIKNSFWSLLSTLTARIGGLIFTIIAARYLMPEGFGLYSLAFSVAIVIVTIADFGVNQAMVRYVSSEIDKNKNKAAAYFQYLLKLKVVLSVASFFVLLLIAYPLANFVFNKPELFPLFLILSFYMLFLAIEGFFESLFYIKNKVSYVSIKEAVFQFLRISLAIAVFYFFDRAFYVIGVTAAVTMSAILIFFLVLYFYKREFLFLSNKTLQQIDKKRVRKFVLFVTIASLSAVLFSYIDTIILGIFLPNEYVGYYRAVIGIIIALAGTLSFTAVFLPVLTRIKDSKLQSSFDKIIKYLMILVIPAIIGIIMLARYFLVLIYGYDYLKATILVYYLAPLIFLMTMVSLFSNLLTSREETKELAGLTLKAAIINITLNYVFIKFFLQYSEIAATIGLAAAMLISWTAYFVGIVAVTKKKLGINFKLSLLTKPMIASLVMAAFLYYINRNVIDMTPLLGFIEVSASIVIYFVILTFLGGVKRDDAHLLVNVVRAKN